MLRIVYSALLYALAPFLWAWLRRSAHRRGGARFRQERRGHYAAATAQAPLWLHCASVGEVRTAAPLIQAIALQRPELPLLVTTATATGAETATRILPPHARHAYLPVDWPGAVRRFLETFHPCGAVILETEIWPNLYAATARRGIPLVLANARLSERTMEAPALIRRLQATALAHATEVLARSREDARRFRDFGVPAQRVRVLGSLKLAPPIQAIPEPFDLGRPTIVAASTHDDEEVRIARAWGEARHERDVPSLLVIVPRHPERGPAIRQSLQQLGFRTALRSAGEDWRWAEIYIADTLGELEGFMAGAQLVVIGGSLIRRGGQNLIEPARLGRPILFGPHMSNFAEESERLLAAGGAQRFFDESDLRHAIGELARDPAERREMGEAAAGMVQAAQDTAELYARAVLGHLNGHE
ncbi:MAG: 3-deoxy-D-manno-octulosonic acid transferase [Halorhodospira sp.]